MCWPANIVGFFFVGVILYDVIKKEYSFILFHILAGIVTTLIMYQTCVVLGTQVSAAVLIVPLVFVLFYLIAQLFTEKKKEVVTPNYVGDGSLLLKMKQIESGKCGGRLVKKDNDKDTDTEDIYTVKQTSRAYNHFFSIPVNTIEKTKITKDTKDTHDHTHTHTYIPSLYSYFFPKESCPSVLTATPK